MKDLNLNPNLSMTKLVFTEEVTKFLMNIFHKCDFDGRRSLSQRDLEEIVTDYCIRKPINSRISLFWLMRVINGDQHF